MSGRRLLVGLLLVPAMALAFDEQGGGANGVPITPTTVTASSYGRFTGSVSASGFNADGGTICIRADCSTKLHDNAGALTLTANSGVVGTGGNLQVNGTVSLGAGQSNYFTLTPAATAPPSIKVDSLNSQAGMKFFNGTPDAVSNFLHLIMPLKEVMPRLEGRYQVVEVGDSDFGTAGVTRIGMPARTNFAGGGTCTPAADSTLDKYESVKFPTGANIGDACGFSGPFTTVSPTYLPSWSATVCTDASAITTTREYHGLTSANLASVATLAGTNAIKYCSFRFDTGLSDTVWQACSSEGTTASCTTTTITVAANTCYRLAIDNSLSGTCDFYVDGTRRVAKTTNITTAVTAMGVEMAIWTLGASARAFSTPGMYLSRLGN